MFVLKGENCTCMFKSKCRTLGQYSRGLILPGIGGLTFVRTIFDGGYILNFEVLDLFFMYITCQDPSVQQAAN